MHREPPSQAQSQAAGHVLRDVFRDLLGASAVSASHIALPPLTDSGDEDPYRQKLRQVRPTCCPFLIRDLLSVPPCHASQIATDRARAQEETAGLLRLMASLRETVRVADAQATDAARTQSADIPPAYQSLNVLVNCDLLETHGLLSPSAFLPSPKPAVRAPQLPAEPAYVAPTTATTGKMLATLRSSARPRSSDPGS